MPPPPARAWATSPATQAALTSIAPSEKGADHEPCESKASPCVSPAGAPGWFAFWFAFWLGIGLGLGAPAFFALWLGLGLGAPACFASCPAAPLGLGLWLVLGG